jgi:hypothetical protein
VIDIPPVMEADHLQIGPPQHRRPRAAIHGVAKSRSELQKASSDSLIYRVFGNYTTRNRHKPPPAAQSVPPTSLALGAPKPVAAPRPHRGACRRCVSPAVRAGLGQCPRKAFTSVTGVTGFRLPTIPDAAQDWTFCRNLNRWNRL